MKNYNFLVYGLDIETSTIEYKDGSKCSYMISFCVGCLDFNNGVYEDVYFGRTYEDLDAFLISLNEKVKGDTLVYIHNMAFEFSFFLSNVDFFKRGEQSKRDFLFIDLNKPLFYKVDNLEFRCSYLLLNKSIKQIGEEIGLKKLDYEYKKIRTPLTPLTAKEKEYNFKDVEIMLKGVYSLMQNTTEIKNISDIPLTYTGVSRFICKHNKDINTPQITATGKKSNLYRYDLRVVNGEKAQTLEQLKFWESIFQGGLVYSNFYYIGKVSKNVASFDFSSSYPTQMCYRFFPYGFTEYTKSDKVEYFKKISDNLDISNALLSSLCYTYFNVQIKVKNVKAIYTFLPLGTSKILNWEELKNGANSIYINGKIKSIDIAVIVNFTCIDYLIFKTFYTFDLVDVLYLETTSKKRSSTKYRLNCVQYAGEKKREYKGYNAIIQNATAFKTYTEEEIRDKDFLSLVNSAKDLQDQQQKSKARYLQIKGILNSQYGDNAQHLLHYNIKYDFSVHDYIKDPTNFIEYQQTQQKTSYIYGVYIVAYSRLMLAFLCYKMLQNNIEILYTDTDSVKVKNSKKADDIVKDFNSLLQTVLTDEAKKLKFGYCEKEFIYSHFTSIGTKSYIYEYEGLIHATISGLPNASRIYNTLYHDVCNCSFEDLVVRFYHYNIIFDSALNDKKTILYKADFYNLSIGDYSESVYTGAVISDMEICLRDFSSKNWFYYAKILSRYFGISNSVFDHRTRIFLNSGGGLSYTDTSSNFYIDGG